MCSNEDKSLCFLHQKAEMHGFATKFIYSKTYRKNNSSAARLNEKTSKNCRDKADCNGIFTCAPSVTSELPLSLSLFLANFDLLD